MGRIGQRNPARVPMMEIEKEAHNQRDQGTRRPAIFRAGEYDQIVEAADVLRECDRIGPQICFEPFLDHAGKRLNLDLRDQAFCGL